MRDLIFAFSLYVLVLVLFIGIVILTFSTTEIVYPQKHTLLAPIPDPVPNLAPPRMKLVWLNDYGKALTQAKKEKKLLLIFFTMQKCPWCDKLKKEFETVWLGWLGEDFVLCRLEYEKNRKLARQLSIKSFPMLLVVREKVVLARMVGYRPAKQVSDGLRLLLKYVKKKGKHSTGI